MNCVIVTLQKHGKKEYVVTVQFGALPSSKPRLYKQNRGCSVGKMKTMYLCVRTKHKGGKGTTAAS